MQTWQVILLGLIEGLTEFLPVSSTGHLLLVGHFLGFHSPGRTFEVLIQLGAILAVATVYAAKLWQLVCDLPSSARASPRRRRSGRCRGSSVHSAAVSGRGGCRTVARPSPGFS